jgi:hypothetical protein
VIKQFNFYDIYGYLLPGMLLLGLFWLPVGVLTQTWPDQDLSKALFLAGLAYIVGHVLYSIAKTVVPSKVTDKDQHRRVLSELLLDKGNSKFTEAFKAKLAGQVSATFGLDLGVEMDGDGENDHSNNRNIAFLQARAYLVANKSAQYSEQFEGLYTMMRSLGCAFCAGAAYFAGWGLSFHRARFFLSVAMGVLFASGMAGALAAAWTPLLFKSKPGKPEVNSPKLPVSVWKKADFWLTFCLLAALLGAGFWARAVPPNESLHSLPACAEYIFWTSAFIALIAAARCFSSYRAFASNFAETVWRDFSAYLSFQQTPVPAIGDASDES